MNKLTSLALFLLLSLTSSARGWYFANISSGGNDVTGNGTISLPFASITKLNSIFSTFTAGDQVLFNGGDVFYGTITTNKAGTTGAKIIIGSYGTGRAIISGFTTLTGWTNTGTNLWESAATTNINKPWMCLISGTVGQIARFPNTGYGNAYTSFGVGTRPKSGGGFIDTSVTVPGLSAIIPGSFAGGLVVVPKLHDQRTYYPITSIVGDKISYNNIVDAYVPIAGYKIILEDALVAVDTVNEWYHNPTTHKTTVYSVGMPTNVQIATIDTLIYIKNSNVTVTNLSFLGGNFQSVTIGNPSVTTTDNITIRNCDINYNGADAVYATRGNNITIDSCNINYTLNNGIIMQRKGVQVYNSIITNNRIKYTGYKPGMWIANGNAITLTGNKSYIYNNRIDTVGHIGIAYYFDSIQIINNLINYYCSVGGDAGAINTFDASYPTVVLEKGRIVRGNIIINGALGEHIGTPDVQDVVMGGYHDDRAAGVIFNGNFISGVPYAAIYGHNATDMQIDSNIIFDAALSQLQLTADNHALDQAMKNISFRNNLVVSNTAAQQWVTVNNTWANIDTVFNTINNNRYCRPSFITGNTFNTIVNYGRGNTKANYIFTAWQTKYNAAINGAYDPASTQMGTNPNAADFVYNQNDYDSVLTFTGLSYLVLSATSPYQTVFDNSMPLKSHTGYVRLANGNATPVNKFPVANAGPDRSFNLPQDSVHIVGSAHDTDGIIVSYGWMQLAGPNTATITPTFSATDSTMIATGLIEGTYQLQLTATDNNGATGTSIVRVTVGAAVVVNVPPVANAGADSTVQLPMSLVHLLGSATDGSGTITSHTWTVFSQPAGSAATFDDASQYNVLVSGLIEGTYLFQLSVTDSNGLTSTDLVQVVVRPVIVNTGRYLLGYWPKAN